MVSIWVVSFYLVVTWVVNSENIIKYYYQTDQSLFLGTVSELDVVSF